MARLPALAQRQVPKPRIESSMPPSKAAAVTSTKKIQIVIPSVATEGSGLAGRNLLFLSDDGARGARIQ
jgi:hypothetical protein